MTAPNLARFIEWLRTCQECGRWALSDDEIEYGHDCEVTE